MQPVDQVHPIPRPRTRAGLWAEPLLSAGVDLVEIGYLLGAIAVGLHSSGNKKPTRNGATKKTRTGIILADTYGEPFAAHPPEVGVFCIKFYYFGCELRKIVPTARTVDVFQHHRVGLSWFYVSYHLGYSEKRVAVWALNC